MINREQILETKKRIEKIIKKYEQTKLQHDLAIKELIDYLNERINIWNKTIKWSIALNVKRIVNILLLKIKVEVVNQDINGCVKNAGSYASNNQFFIDINYCD